MRPPIALQAEAVLVTDMGQKHHIITLTLAHPLPAGDACIAERGRTRQARNPRDVTCITLHRNSTDHSSFQALMNANLTGFGLQRRSPPFLALSFPHAAGVLLCEGGCFPFQRLHAVLTSGRHADAVEPICSASKAQLPNLMKVKAPLSHWSSPCEPHHFEPRLCISLPFFISFIANIARKRPERKRDKTMLQRIAEYILSKPSQMTLMSAEELGDSAGVSVASVYRFCKEMDFKTFTRLKLAIAKELSAEAKGALLNTATRSTTENLFDEYTKCLVETEQFLKNAPVTPVVSLIENARRIVVVGIGASGTAASFFHYKLLRAGLVSHHPVDMHLAAMLKAMS